MKRQIDDVVEALQTAKQRGTRCSLLIGAGCSVEAGIPTAAGFVDAIREQHERAYQRAENKTYPACMSELPPGARQALIAQFVDRAVINWGHVGVAALIKAGYVDRVLTTNFDPLIIRACALLGEFPAVYDFAASQLFKPDAVPDRSVFYLHGQRTGFVLMNTHEEVEKHSEALRPLFDAAGGRLWIVVGYSGENDSVFRRLADVPHFDHELYWVGYRDMEPSHHVRDQLLQPGKYAFHVPGHTADSFFVELTQRLGIFPPEFIARPFSHLATVLQTLGRYSPPGTSQGIDVTEVPLRSINQAIAQFELNEGSVAANVSTDPAVAKAVEAMMSGNYAAVVALSDTADAPELVRLVAWAHALLGQQKAASAEERGPSAEADQLYAEAGYEYRTAVKILPTFGEALKFWGKALSEWAGHKSGVEEDALYAEASEKYAAAVAAAPDDYETLMSWGDMLVGWAGGKTGAEADRLYEQAIGCYQSALRLKPDDYDILNALANALSDWARQRNGAESDRLFTKAEEKFVAAIQIQPEKADAWYNWAVSTAEWANHKTGSDRVRMLYRANNRFAGAAPADPDDDEILAAWGGVLVDLAKESSGELAELEYRKAEEKLVAAERLVRGSGAFDLARLAALRGDSETCRSWLQRAVGADDELSCDDLVDETAFDRVRHLGWFQTLVRELE